MGNEKVKKSEEKRTTGSVFEMADELHGETQTKRDTGTFTPDSNDTLTDVPEAITAGERLPQISDYENIKLESLPLKGLKTFLYGLGLLIVVIAVAELYSIYQYTLEIHVVAAALYTLIVLLVIGLGLRALWNYLYDTHNVSTLDGIQREASRLREGKTFGNSKPFIEKLKTFYDGKPQAIYLQRCIDQLPDYNNDQETIDHLERVFLEPLDKEAMRRVSAHCFQTGNLIALSPWVAADMLLSLWRSIKMIDEISQVYGLRPSLTNRLKLIKIVMRKMLFVGVTELATDKAIESLGLHTLAAAASARVGQGISAAIYTSKIGIAAMEVTRPVEFSEANLPSSSAVIGPMLQKLKSLVTKFGS